VLSGRKLGQLCTGRFGLEPVETFPLSEHATYSYASEFSAAPGKHHGIDIFAARGLGVLSVAAGKVRAARDAKGGKVLYLDANDGWRYYYAHLDSWNPPIDPSAPPLEVDAGVLLGAVGNTGNAAGTAPHIHFQAWSPLTGLTDPFPELQAVDPHVVLPNLGVVRPVPPIPPVDAEPAETTPVFGSLALLLGLALLKGKR
jgi:murein DD-endopeptidase MepM/ murein hydrolase activator NlpD